MNRLALPARASLIASIAVFATTPSVAQDDAIFCSDFEPEYYDPDYPYTDQELAELRSREVRRALGTIERCAEGGGEGEGQGEGSGAGSGQGTGGGSNGGSGGGNGTGPVASNIGGTEAAKIPQISQRPSREAREARAAVDREEIVLGNPPPTDRDDSPPPTAGDGGAPPERIRDVDNDDAVARQIRKAAEAETDPTRQQALWDEYYRYTGRRPRTP